MATKNSKNLEKRRKKASSIKQVTLTLPKLFPSMTKPDLITILQWNYRVGDVLPVDPEQILLVVSCVRGKGSLHIPDFLIHSHRIVQILAPVGATLQLDDPLFVLEPVDAECV